MDVQAIQFSREDEGVSVKIHAFIPTENFNMEDIVLLDKVIRAIGTDAVKTTEPVEADKAPEAAPEAAAEPTKPATRRGRTKAGEAVTQTAPAEDKPITDATITKALSEAADVMGPAATKDIFVPFIPEGEKPSVKNVPADTRRKLLDGLREAIDKHAGAPVTEATAEPAKTTSRRPRK